jgi:hypothetical protein
MAISTMDIAPNVLFVRECDGAQVLHHGVPTSGEVETYRSNGYDTVRWCEARDGSIQTEPTYEAASSVFLERWLHALPARPAEVARL